MLSKCILHNTNLQHYAIMWRKCWIYLLDKIFFTYVGFNHRHYSLFVWVHCFVPINHSCYAREGLFFSPKPHEWLTLTLIKRKERKKNDWWPLECAYIILVQHRRIYTEKSLVENRASSQFTCCVGLTHELNTINLKGSEFMNCIK